MDSFRISEIEKLQSTPALAYMLRLMMSTDAMRSSIRWLNLLGHAEDSTSGNNLTHLVLPIDRLVNMITSAGWAAETIMLVQDGAKKKFVRREMLRGHNELLHLWDDMLAREREQPPYLSKLFRIRDNYFIHWGSDVATEFVNWQTSSGHTVPFMQSSGGKFLETSYPWAYMAVVRHFLGGSLEIEKWKEGVAEIGALIGRISSVTSYLTLGILTQHNITLEEYQPDESDSAVSQQ